MASPQKENGFTPIANEILEALCKVNLSPYESRVIWFLLRKTYGWKKKSDWISQSQFSEGLDLDRRHIHRTIKRLLRKEIIVISTDDKNRSACGFQKDYSKWRMSSLEMTAPLQMTRYAYTDDTGAPLQAHTKETIQKKRARG